MVVSYRNSTSNHNARPKRQNRGEVVSYRNSTSNHNEDRHGEFHESVVSYRNSTSNHNLQAFHTITESVVSYRNSTSNHNSGGAPVAPGTLYLIEILHQTTTKSLSIPHNLRCILSKFYIKPQRITVRCCDCSCCILSKFYIKPQR